MYPHFASVSYTHLDVYKRQPYPILWIGLRRIALLAVTQFTFASFTAVSYTHLDVYKRQFQDCIDTRRLFPVMAARFQSNIYGGTFWLFCTRCV